MKVTKALLSVLFVLFLSACLKDRKIPGLEQLPINPGDTTSTIQPGDLRVNELVAHGSNEPDEFGVPEDWVEIYNTTDFWIRTQPENFWLSDDKSNIQKYTVRNTWFIPPKGFLLYFANGRGVEGGFINTSFGLSRAGEDCVIAWRNPGSTDIIVIDQMSYTDFPTGQSLGLRPDGNDTIYFKMIPTPGKKNL